MSEGASTPEQRRNRARRGGRSGRGNRADAEPPGGKQHARELSLRPESIPFVPRSAPEGVATGTGTSVSEERHDTERRPGRGRASNRRGRLRRGQSNREKDAQPEGQLDAPAQAETSRHEGPAAPDAQRPARGRGRSGRGRGGPLIYLPLI